MVGWSIALCLLGVAAVAVGIALQLLARRRRRRAAELAARAERESLTRIGAYEIVGELGEGGMGTVFAAVHVALGRPTAIKLVKPSSDRTARARFEREAEMTGALSHPHAVTLFDAGKTDSGVAWIALELVPGVTLDRLLRAEGPLPARRVFGILRQIASALAHAHRRDIVHRDIKPSNVMLSPDDAGGDIVKIIDFGLAKRLSHEDRAQVRTSIVGTPLFMAPESSDPASEVGPEVDVYGVGMIGYALLTGTFLFGDHSPQSLARAHLTEPPLPPSLKTDADVPPDLERVILRCLAKDPRGRYADGGALLDALEGCEPPPETNAAPPIRPPQRSGIAERELVDTKAFPLVKRKQA